MPIYEYRCAACGHELDALQKLADAPLKKCPECGKSKLHRLMSAPSFRLKGGGWYETDFKGDGEKKRNLVETGDNSGDKSDKPDKAAEPAAAKSDTGDGAKKESKPEAPAPAPASGEKKKSAAKKSTTSRKKPSKAPRSARA
jgi:putative FmdB family regulatory protein